MGYKYEIVDVNDISHAAAKRYEAKIIVRSSNGKGTIRTIASKAVEILKNSDVYKNEIAEKAWKGKPCNVVWIDIAKNKENMNKFPPKWICQVCWIDPELSKEFHPDFEYDEIFNDVMIKWGKK